MSVKSSEGKSDRLASVCGGSGKENVGSEETAGTGSLAKMFHEGTSLIGCKRYYCSGSRH